MICVRVHRGRTSTACASLEMAVQKDYLTTGANAKPARVYLSACLTPCGRDTRRTAVGRREKRPKKGESDSKFYIRPETPKSRR